ncbi:MAG: acetolactate synthase large subunit [Rothia sp. (in: high G+C Gram-positive bacteria)]|uniref:acetolactate synthase large subunit n=1 Tax=Rothia sp. (in: high G+C Gram-positive bacteria) TaxID=1885016 RepID=UPI0027045DE2|nr:acetolactate synthase large subunit [Rothia sp. (in: high G+C Gram-positive bacteria)]
MTAGNPINPADLAKNLGNRSGSETSPVERMTGSQAIVRSLEELGVTDIFGLPGGAILPTYDPLFDSEKLNHILVRHEQGAGHAAEGYSIASGKVGVAIATSGPGATNLLTAIADANMDSVPLVCITGQVSSKVIGTDAFQEADIVGMTMPITKHSFMVRDAQEIPRCIATAFKIAATGRPGPVLVDITKDAQQGMMDFSWPPANTDPRGYNPVTRGHSKQIREAAKLITESQRPVLYVGGGVVRAEASEELLKLAKTIGAPVVTTLTARGAYPDSDPQNLGMPGMHGTVPAVTAMQKSDLLIALGARFDDRVTGVVSEFAPHAKVIHVDVDPAEISKIRIADVPIVGDLRYVLPDLNEILEGEFASDLPDLTDWWKLVNRFKDNYPLGYTKTDDGLGSPQYVIQKLSELTGPDAYYVTGVGQHQMWAAQFIQSENPRHFINSAGLGTMGFSVPAAMGVKVAFPDSVVWAIDGDGCFQMTNQELATCVQNNIPIKVAIINNSSLGMVRQWQNLFYDGRYSNTHLKTGMGTERVPDFVKLAEAYGCAALRCESDEDVEETIKQALAINDRPVVVDFNVSPDALVWPMVPAGVSNDQIQIAKDISASWGEDEEML